MEVAGLLDLQLVDVTAQAHELPGQLLVLKPHLRLQGKMGEASAPRWAGERGGGSVLQLHGPGRAQAR